MFPPAFITPSSAQVWTCCPLALNVNIIVPDKLWSLFSPPYRHWFSGPPPQPSSSREPGWSSSLTTHLPPSTASFPLALRRSHSSHEVDEWARSGRQSGRAPCKPWLIWPLDWRSHHSRRRVAGWSRKGPNEPCTVVESRQSWTYTWRSICRWWCWSQRDEGQDLKCCWWSRQQILLLWCGVSLNQWG
jgi:hypothetical protein